MAYNLVFRNTIANRKSAAYWYAVGWADATDEVDRSEEFSKFAEAEAIAYYSEKTHHLQSVPDQWTRFLKEVAV